MEGQLALFNIKPSIEKLDVRRSAITDGGAPPYYRYELRRWWRAGPAVCWIMLNPSMADADRDDPTMREVVRFSNLWGFGGCLVVNLYPFITPKPAELRRWARWDENGPDWYARDAIMHNSRHIETACRQADQVIAAWGAGAWDRDHVDFAIESVTSGVEPIRDLFCIGTTSDGSPKHPLARGLHRVSRDQRPLLWRAA